MMTGAHAVRARRIRNGTFFALLFAGLAACGGGDPAATSDQAGVSAQSDEAAAERIDNQSPAQPLPPAAPAAPDAPAAPAAPAAAATAPGSRPNLVLIVADDLGWSDLGVTGGEIPTPNIDALAGAGMLLTNFYANMSCSPTRAMLMSGTDAHIAGLGIMGAAQSGPQAGAPGYEGILNFDVVALPQLLKDAGYHTYMAGKWHLGNNDVATSPHGRGFERVFASLNGAAHLGPMHWNGPEATYWEDDEIVTVDEDFYSTRVYTERIIDYIESNRGDGRPFFAWYAPTAPHWPLQAPAESIEKFAGRYDRGYDVVHAERLERAKSLSLIDEDFVAEGPPDGEPRWTELTEEERRVRARYMEIYAAMVSDLDTYIGELVAYLDSIDELDNTFILFMSDNGAEGWEISRFQNWVDRCCDNSFENLGAGDSYVLYGRNWAWAGAPPFRRQKFTAFEGGIRVPAFAYFQNGILAGTRNDVIGTAMDVMPTFLELAGVEHPAPSYNGRTVEPMQGRSLLPELTATGELEHDNYWFGIELYGHRAIRQGDWKIVWDAAAPDGERGWALYNLADDPAEQRDLAAAEPERFAAMQRLWHQYERNNGVILTTGLNSQVSEEQQATDTSDD